MLNGSNLTLSSDVDQDTRELLILRNGHSCINKDIFKENLKLSYGRSSQRQASGANQRIKALC